MRIRYVKRKHIVRELQNIFPTPVGMPGNVLQTDPVKLKERLIIKPDTSLINQSLKYPFPMRWDAVIKMIPEGKKLIGAEIGVLHGETAFRILKHRAEVTHIMIDPWEVPKKDSSYALSGDNNSKKPQQSHDTAYHLTRTRVAFAGDRAIIMRMESKEAVLKFENEYFDYIFIDGDHSYTGVIVDIRMWLSKVKKGGWIGGHDYGNERLPGVKKAVDEMFNKEDIILSHEDTWFVMVKK